MADPIKPQPGDKIVCNICGQEMLSASPLEMAEHMLFNHPWELVESPNFRKGLTTMAEDLGCRFARFLKGQ
jgi:hypothetical protein